MTRGTLDGRPALVVVDMQNKFVVGGIEDRIDGVLRTVNSAVAAFRDAGLPVVFVTMEGEGHGIPEGMEDPHGFVPGLDVRDGDRVIVKAFMNAFNGTPLADVLAAEGCDSVVVCGLVSRWCVQATYFGAYDRGLSAYILEGGTAGSDPRHTELVEELAVTVALDGLPRGP